ncbi:MAG: hypothetical protein P8N76_09245 [Pirellulaceae bacterium]|nr:hypothetical protein [Pirellulaceae bacterium]
MLPILNETRNWTGDVGEIETEAAVVDPATGQEIKPCTRVKHAFMREEAVAARISAGSMLYKFNGFPAFPRPGAGPNEEVSPWWSPYGEFEIQGMGQR